MNLMTDFLSFGPWLTVTVLYWNVCEAYKNLSWCVEWEKVTLTMNHEPFQFQAFSVHIDFLINECETAKGCCSFVLNFLQSTNSTVVYQLSTLHQTKYEGNVESLVFMTMWLWPWSRIPNSISNLMPFGLESLVLVMNCKSTHFLCVPILCVPIAQRNSHKLFNLLSASQHHIWVFPLLPERQQKLRTQIVYNGLPKFWQIIICLSTLTVGSWWTQSVVMAARHCRLWWRWWSVTLWATLMRLWLHSLSCYL